MAREHSGWSWNWHGVVAVLLALAVGVTLVLAEIAIILRNGHATQDETTLISTAFGAAVGAVAVYLGGRDDPRLYPPEQASTESVATEPPEVEPWFEAPPADNVADREGGG